MGEEKKLNVRELIKNLESYKNEIARFAKIDKFADELEIYNIDIEERKELVEKSFEIIKKLEESNPSEKFEDIKSILKNILNKENAKEISVPELSLVIEKLDKLNNLEVEVKKPSWLKQISEDGLLTGIRQILSDLGKKIFDVKISNDYVPVKVLDSHGNIIERFGGTSGNLGGATNQKMVLYDASGNVVNNINPLPVSQQNVNEYTATDTAVTVPGKYCMTGTLSNSTAVTIATVDSGEHARVLYWSASNVSTTTVRTFEFYFVDNTNRGAYVALGKDGGNMNANLISSPIIGGDAEDLLVKASGATIYYTVIFEVVAD